MMLICQQYYSDFVVLWLYSHPVFGKSNFIFTEYVIIRTRNSLNTEDNNIKPV